MLIVAFFIHYIYKTDMGEGIKTLPTPKMQYKKEIES